jgi:hypothetical protein
MRSPYNLILGVLAGLALACSDGTSPSSAPDAAPSFQSGQTADQARHEQLKQQLEAEKDRIKRERESRKLEFELARAEWKIYKGGLKRAKKLGTSSIELLRCEPKPFEGDAAIIGPEGGTLHIGEHELVIPRGALDEERLIVGEAPTSSLVDVEFQPEGLQFQRAATLTLSYKGCERPDGVDLSLAYIGFGNRILELPPSEDRRSELEVSGEIHHFSRYAVAF